MGGDDYKEQIIMVNGIISHSHSCALNGKECDLCGLCKVRWDKEAVYTDSRQEAPTLLTYISYLHAPKMPFPSLGPLFVILV